MGSFHDAPIVQKIYDFYRDLYLVIEKMPKKDKYSLGIKLEEISLSLLELTIAAGNLQQKEKLIPLNKANIKIDVLKTLLRLTYDIHAIDQKKYLTLEEKLQEIGKMLGGWIRSIKASA
jgi:four helix bundle protein